MPVKTNLSELRQEREFWPEFNEDAMQKDAYEVFSKRKLAVDYYIDGMKLNTITENTGINKQEVLRLVHRCRSFNESGNQAGYSPLIPRFQLANKLGKIEKLFLQYPSLETYISGNYFGDKEYTLEHGMNIRTLHSKFLEECLRLGVQDYVFPFDNKDKGYYTLRNYVKKLEATHHADTIKRNSKDAQQRFNSTGYGETSSFKSIFPYDVVQIDGHKIDLLYSVETENEQGEIVRMTAIRMWVIAVIDVATRAILGYSVTPSENYNQFDVLRAIRNSIVPHEKIHFTHEGLQYPDNGGFPSTCISETQWAIYDTIMLDNAKSHLAGKVVKKLTGDLKCTLNFGSVATPETRGIIERFFKSLETRGFHCLPGTTGSNIRDTKRNNPERESVKYAITYDDICELLEYLIAIYNNTPHSSLENQTPMQAMDRKIHDAGMQPCIVNEQEREKVQSLICYTEERDVCGGYNDGGRPRINFGGVSYHASDVKLPMDLIGKKVCIEINPNDVSHVKMFNENGIFLADMVATGEWGSRPHSLQTRQLALKRKNANKASNTNYSLHLTGYENDLRREANKSRRARTTAATIEREYPKGKNVPEEFIELDLDIPKEDKEASLTPEQIESIYTIGVEAAFKRGII